VTDRQTDRQTDRRTDGQTDRILIAIPRLHYMQRGKNQSTVSVLPIAVTDNEVMYISVDEKYRNLSIRDSELCDADKKTSRRGHCVTQNMPFRTATYFYLYYYIC